jgi:chemotaxis protein CheD
MNQHLAPAQGRRYWDVSESRWIAQILPGEFHVSREDEVISTVLGSCVSTCMRDPAVMVGGMNHFMLPADLRGDGIEVLRYGTFAVERLVLELVGIGARRDRLEVKMFGGGRVIAGMSDIGRSNIDFVRHYTSAQGLLIAAEDVGGNWGRRLRYYPRSGRALVWRLSTEEVQQIAKRELVHRRILSTRPPPPDDSSGLE